MEKCTYKKEYYFKEDGVIKHGRLIAERKTINDTIVLHIALDNEDRLVAVPAKDVMVMEVVVP